MLTLILTVVAASFLSYMMVLVRGVFSEEGRAASDRAIRELIAGLERLKEVNKAKAAATTSGLDNPQPPKLAEYVICFFPKSQRDDMLGDLAELYPKMYRRQGKLRAQFWCWCQVATLFYPLLRRVARWLLTAGVINWLIQAGVIVEVLARLAPVVMRLIP